MSATTLAQLIEILQTRGQARYDGEEVSQLQHALQAATLALNEDAPASLVAAALFHDIGHLVHDLGEHASAQGLDDRHEYRALRWLKPAFDADVWEPVHLHVEAKRYLCNVEAGYIEQLSAESLASLALQGGPMDAGATRAFAAEPHAQNAVRLRRWDDAAKDVNAQTPSLAYFADYLKPIAKR